MMWTRKFWRGTAERAIKTTAQVAGATIAVGATSLLDVDWRGLLALAGLGGLMSVLTSIGSAKATDSDSPSLVR